MATHDRSLRDNCNHHSWLKFIRRLVGYKTASSLAKRADRLEALEAYPTSGSEQILASLNGIAIKTNERLNDSLPLPVFLIRGKRADWRASLRTFADLSRLYIRRFKKVK